MTLAEDSSAQQKYVQPTKQIVNIVALMMVRGGPQIIDFSERLGPTSFRSHFGISKLSALGMVRARGAFLIGC